MTKYAVPHPLDLDAQASFEESRLVFRSHSINVVLAKSAENLDLTCNNKSIDVQHDLLKIVSTTTGLDESVANSLIRRFISLNYGFPFSMAIEEWFQHTHPLIKEITKDSPQLSAPISLPRRLEGALRQPTLKLAAAEYWQEDSCGSAAARAFAESLVVENKICESKVSWLSLAPSTLRHELVGVDVRFGSNAFPVTPHCRSMFSELAPRTTVEVVKRMMGDPAMPLVVSAGQQLGYQMSGRDPVRIITDLQQYVRAHGYGRCRDFGEYLTKRGLSGNKVTQICSAHDLVVAGSVLKNCLNNPSQPYRHGVLSGRYRIFCIGERWELGALAFNPNTWELIEAKGPRNAPLQNSLIGDLEMAVSEWRTMDA